MKRVAMHTLLAPMICLLLVASPLVSAEGQPALHQQGPRTVAKPSAASFAKALLPFVENQGQVQPEVSFYTHTFAGTVFVSAHGITYALPDMGSSGRPRRGVAIKEKFLPQGALRPRGMAKSAAVVSYFVGDKKDWRSHVPTYDGVDLGEPWPGIQVELRAYAKNLEKSFHVQPGAHVESIRIGIEGAKTIRVNEEGLLLLETELGPVAMSRPVAYQQIDNLRKPVEVAYVVNGTSYGFAVGSYDPKSVLVIDPLLASTFVGGDATGGFGDRAEAIALDAAGAVFIAGRTDRSDYPTTTGAYDTSINGGLDVVVSKLDSSLTSLQASTFIGGSADDEARAIALDPFGNVFVTGGTTSSNYPTTPLALDTTYDGGVENSFVSKLNNGLSMLLASTFVGGNSADDRAVDIAINAVGEVYVAGLVQDPNFATTPLAYDTSFNGIGDVFVAKLDNNLTSRLAATFLGGSLFDTGGHLAFDGSGNVYVAGNTESSDFPTTLGAYDTSFNSTGFRADAFVSKLNNGLTMLLASTFVGGSDHDGALDIALDSAGNVFIVGQTFSSDFPTTAGAHDTSFNGGFDDGYVSKLDGNLSSLLASTFIGGSGSEFARAVGLDAGTVFVAGTTSSSDFPTTSGAIDTSLGGSHDGYVSRLSSNLASLLDSTFLGGSSIEELTDLVLDASGLGIVFVTGLTSSSDFPVTPGAYDTTFSPSDLFVSKLAFGPPPPSFVLDHFKCYKVDKEDRKFTKRTVTLVDQFGDAKAEVVKLMEFCNPVRKKKDEEITEISHEDAHLKIYEINDTMTEEKRNVSVTNQFGRQLLQVEKAELLLVPAAKGRLGPNRDLNHFKCYKVGREDPKFEEGRVDLRDQFVNESVLVHKPRYLCNPVDKNDEGITRTRGRDHLIYYEAKGDKEKFTVNTRDQFSRRGGERLELGKSETLLVPSNKRLLENQEK